MTLGDAEMEFHDKDSFAASHALEGYEHLILMAMIGDESLFTASEGIERLWEISEPLLENPPPVEPYAVGSWGPPSVDKLIVPYRWHLPERQVKLTVTATTVTFCNRRPGAIRRSSGLHVPGSGDLFDPLMSPD
jgi:hypothetical protein